LLEDSDDVKPIDLSVDLGWMLYDIKHEKGKTPLPEFFQARLENGVLHTNRNELRNRTQTVEVRS
jgi:hypothetical protein